MKGMTRATAMRRAAMYAVLAVLCCPGGWAQHPHQSAPAPRSAPSRQTAPHPQNRVQQQGRPAGPQGRGNNVPLRPQPVNPNGTPLGATRPAYPGATYSGAGTVRPALPGYPGGPTAPPGHLQSWLNAHKNVPVQNQEQQLRGDPSFRRLPQGEQQRLVQQLHNVNQMPDQVRERRLARAEMMERLSPEDRMHVNRSAREWTTLPANRQAMMKNAFRDLRSVPPDQRGIVLNSARYQGQFSPQERGILTDMLRVEPYEAPK